MKSKLMGRIAALVLVAVISLAGCDLVNSIFDREPVANAGGDFSITLGEEATLDGANSFDPEGVDLEYSWEFVALGSGSGLSDADIESGTSAVAYFTPDVTGIFDVQLTVSDGARFATDTVRITVEAVDLSYLEGEDDQGNIVVNNTSGNQLVLYRGDVPLKIIPDDSSDFLINIPNPDAEALDLRLYKYGIVAGDIGNANLGDVFKRWTIVLAGDTEIEHRVTWRVGALIDDVFSGTLTFAYVGGTEYSVDVYLNSQSGAKIMSLSPGQQNKRVGIDYGNYTVHYLYWESNPQSTEGITEIGWTEAEMVNDEEVPIYVILNASRDELHMQVPHWNGGGAIVAQYGTIEVRNNTSQPVQLWVGSQLIEQVMYTDQPIDNYSTIAANDVTTYTMPVGEYTIVAKNLSTTAEVGTTTLTVVADAQVDWTIEN